MQTVPVATFDARVMFVQNVLNRVQIKDKEIRLVSLGGDALAVQLQYVEPDIHTGRLELQRTRKWVIEDDADDDSIIRTVYKAAEASALHQLGEHFLVNGERLYSPHHKVDSLIAVAARDGL